jgi:hypothetical protein
MKEIQSSSEGNPSRIGRESKLFRKEIQIKSFHFLRRIEPSQGLTATHTTFFFWAASGFKRATAARALIVCVGSLLVPSVFLSVPPVS